MLKTVIIKRSDYDALQNKDQSSIYLTDDGCMFRGGDKYIREGDLAGQVSVGSLRIGRYVLADDGTELVLTNTETEDELGIF